MPGNCPNVGINELKKPYVVTYPNPSSDIINLYVESLIDKIEIFDNLGRLIFNQKHINGKSLRINSSNMKGFYRLKIVLSNKEVLFKNLISY